MAPRAALFHQVDVKRAVKGALAAGLPVGRVEVGGDGTIVIFAASETDQHTTKRNPWDKVFVDGEEFNAKAQPDGYTVEVVSIIPTSQAVSLMAKIGYFDFDADTKVNGQRFDSFSDDGLTLGAGITADVSEHVSVRLEANWYNTDDSAWVMGFGAQWNFGGSK